MAPTFKERVALAARAVGGIFSQASATQAYGLLQGMWPGGLGEAPTRGARERIGAYADMPWVYALADKVAYAQATVDWHLYAIRKKGKTRAERVKSVQDAHGETRRTKLIAHRESGELVEIENHPLLTALSNGNSMMTGLAVRKVTALHIDLEGESFWMKERDELGVPIAFWPLPPDWVRATPTVQNPTYLVAFRGWHGRIPDSEIVWLPNPNPSNPYGRGTGMVRALADELETDEMAGKAIRQTFFNQARPDFVVYPDEDGVEWGEPQRQRLALDWQQQHEGFWRIAKPRFASRKLGIHEFANTDHRKLEMTKLRESARDAIRQVWGVPPEIMGIVEPGASRATITRADYVFSKWVVEPRLEMFRSLLQVRVVPEYDDRIIIDYDSPIQDDKEFALEVATAAPYSLSINEWRAMGQRESLDDKQGDLHALPTNYTFGELKEGAGGKPEADKPKPKPKTVTFARENGFMKSVTVTEEE